MTNILGDFESLKGKKRLSLRYILDLEEWKELAKSSKSLSQLRGVWSQIARIEPIMKNLDVADTLICAFGKRGSLKDAVRVFDAIMVKNAKSWILVLCGFALSRCFQQAVHKGMLEDLQRKFDTGPKTQQCWNAMLAAYAQNGHLSDAKQLFDEMPARDVVTWNTMVAASSLNQDSKAAGRFLKRMPAFDQLSWTGLLAVHAQKGYLPTVIALFNNLIPCRDSVAWSIVFAAYSHSKKFKDAMELKRVMDLEGTPPDELSFVSLLLAFPSRRSARRCFWRMIRDHHIQPVKVHYGCMADLLHRAGYRRAIDIQPFKACVPDDDGEWIKRLT